MDPVPGATGLVVARTVIDWPTTAGLALEVSTVVLVAGSTCWVSAVDTTGVDDGVARYRVVIAWLPPVFRTVLRMALPPVTVLVPISVAPS